MSHELLQVVPMLPPGVSGVGDYALLLAQELQAAYGVQTRFLNADPAWRGSETHVAPFAADTVEERSSAALLDALERAAACQTVLLHYVGHGYEKRGCPFWLVRAMEQWKQHTRARLIVLFHEVSGTGPIWTSGFWTEGLQKSLARRLARLGDDLRITTKIAVRRLCGTSSAASKLRLRVQPVFSTMGEPATLPVFQKRARQMVVFGGGGWRRDAYSSYLPSLQEACRLLRIEKVIDIGTPIGLRPNLNIPFVEAGVLPAKEASELMLQSMAGFFTYPVLHIGKSTIFAAYCAHGMAPVTIAENAMCGDEGLQSGEHFLTVPGNASTAEIDISAVAAAAHGWYQQHRLSLHAREIAAVALS